MKRPSARSNSLLIVLLFCSILACPVITSAQSKQDTLHTHNYCPNLQCNLDKNSPAHFDPYFNHHLCEHFNPAQADFSKEYLDLRMRLYENDSNRFEQTKTFDFGSMFITGKTEQNGVIGKDYQRIRVHIDRVGKNHQRLNTYLVTGKTKVKDNICSFKGEIHILSIYFNETCTDADHPGCGVLFADYTFREDTAQAHSGFFNGVIECAFYRDPVNGKILLDDADEESDGYNNRTFVGTWTDYKTMNTLKCIWGDYRLPFTFDFDCGDGEMHVCDQYVKNGWQLYNEGSEYTEDEEDHQELINKWWITPLPPK